MTGKRNIKILVVEDDREDFILLRGILQEEEGPDSFDLTHVSRLNDAFQKLDEAEFDLILLDLSLPDSAGMSIVDKIIAKKPKVPVVVLTGQKENEIGLEALRRGAQDFISKGELKLSLMYSKTITYAIERCKIKNFKEDFLSNVSHELRTPLAIIKESTSQLNDGICGPVTDFQKKYLIRLLSNIDRLETLINDILDISKIEAGRFEIYREKIDLSSVVTEVVNNFSVLAQKKGLELKQSIGENPVIVLADKGKIIQVFTNLIGNAVKFTEKGAITVSVAKRENQFICSISDTGKGIAEIDIAKVFNKFEQFSREHGPGAKGTGLGLVISKNIVEAHQGKIWVESKEGMGSKFIFTLPEYSFEEMLNSSIEQYIKSANKNGQTFGLILLKIKQTGIPPDILESIEEEIKANLFRKTDTLLRKDNQYYVFLNEVSNDNINDMIKRIRKALESRFKEHSSSDAGLALDSAFSLFPADGQESTQLLHALTKGGNSA